MKHNKPQQSIVVRPMRPDGEDRPKPDDSGDDILDIRSGGEL